MSEGGTPPNAAVASRPAGISAFLIRWRLPLILILALLARLPGIASRPLWYDEAFAVLFSSKGLAAMLRGTLAAEGGVAADVHPIFYYTLLWGWQGIVGSSPAAVRGLSVLFGLGTVACGYGLGRRLIGSRPAVVAAILLALSPYQVHYSQETRMYALLALILTAVVWVFHRALRHGRLLDWVGFSALAAASMYAHNLAFTFLLPLSLIPVFQRQWRNALKTLAAGVASIGLYLPWLVQVPMQLARVRSGYWLEAPGAASLVRTLLAFAGGLPLDPWALQIVLSCAVLVVILGLWALAPRAGSTSEERSGASWLAYLAFAPAAVMFAVSLLQPVYLERALLPSGVMFVLWLAWAFSGSGLGRLFRYTGMGALLLAFVLGLWGFYTYRGFPYAPFASLTAYLREQARSSEVIVHSNKISAIPAAYYDPALEQAYLSDPPNSASDTLARATQQVLGLLAEPDVSTAVGEARGVWLVIFPREIDDYRALGFSGHPAIEWLESRYTLDRVEAFGELNAMHFIRAEGVGQ